MGILQEGVVIQHLARTSGILRGHLLGVEIRLHQHRIANHRTVEEFDDIREAQSFRPSAHLHLLRKLQSPSRVPTLQADTTAGDSTPAPPSRPMTGLNPQPGLISGVEETSLPVTGPAPAPAASFNPSPVASAPMASGPADSPIQRSEGSVAPDTGVPHGTAPQPDPTTGATPPGSTGAVPSGNTGAAPTGGSSAATGSAPSPALIPQPMPQRIPGPEKLYMLAADNAHTSVYNSVQPESIVFADETSPSRVLLRSAGPMLFEAALDPATTTNTYYELSTADSMRRSFDASYRIAKADSTSTSFLKSVSVSLELDADTSLFRISEIKVQLSRDDKSNALVFTTNANTVSDEFENGFPATKTVVAAAVAETPTSTKPLAALAAYASQDSPATSSQTGSSDVVSQLSTTAENSTASDGQKLATRIKTPVDVTTLSGIDRYPGSVLLGLQASQGSDGGFQTLSDFCALAGLSTKPWLDQLLKFTKVKLGGLRGTTARNVMWYLPESSSMCCLRLEGQVDLDDNIKGYIGKYLGDFPEIKQLCAIAKRSVVPSADTGTPAEVMGELTLGVELKIVEDRDLGFYISVKEDEITLMLVCYSTQLQWAWLKAWLLKNCTEVQEALEKLHGVLGSVPSSDKESDPAEQYENIKWRKLSVTLSSEEGKTAIKEIFVELEARVSFLVPEGKNAVFRLAFMWNKSDSVFTGMCGFAGDWSGQNVKTLPIQYHVGYERWLHLTPLVPTESYMSLRYIDGIEADYIPYGLPTEIIRAELDISNKRLSFAGEMRSIIKPDTSAALAPTSESPSLKIDNVDFVIEMDIDYFESTKRVDATLAGTIVLLPFRQGDTAAVLDAEIAYHSAQGEWIFHAGVSHLRMTTLHSLFPHGAEKDHAMAILDSIELEKLFISYKHAKGVASDIQFAAIVDIADIVLSTNLKRDSPTTWEISASLQQSQRFEQRDTEETNTWHRDPEAPRPRRCGYDPGLYQRYRTRLLEPDQGQARIHLQAARELPTPRFRRGAKFRDV